MIAYSRAVSDPTSHAPDRKMQQTSCPAHKWCAARLPCASVRADIHLASWPPFVPGRSPATSARHARYSIRDTLEQGLSIMACFSWLGYGPTNNVPRSLPSRSFGVENNQTHTFIILFNSPSGWLDARLTMASGHASPEAIITTKILFTVTAGLLTFARLYTRMRIVRNAGVDDVFIALGLVSVGFCQASPHTDHTDYLSKVASVVLTATTWMQG